MPVPRNRTDDAYFEPLRSLKLRPETELCLGLVHYTDGIDGTKQRARHRAKSMCRLSRSEPNAVSAGAIRRPYRSCCVSTPRSRNWTKMRKGGRHRMAGAAPR